MFNNFEIYDPGLLFFNKQICVEQGVLENILSKKKEYSKYLNLNNQEFRHQSGFAHQSEIEQNDKVLFSTCLTQHGRVGDKK